MKLSKEILNGLLVFFGIAIYFLLMQVLGFSDNYVLRFFNIFIVYFGVYKTLKSNFNEGKLGYNDNLIAAGFTAINGVLMSFVGLTFYIYANGGQSFLNHLSPGFIFSGNPTVSEYCFGLLFEGLASAVIIVFISMQYWRSKMALND